jgi:hypothetical protein
MKLASGSKLSTHNFELSTINEYIRIKFAEACNGDSDQYPHHGIWYYRL